MLKSFYSGIIIKILDWDNDLLKQEYLISIKLKNIINFIDYISYFEFEDNFVHYIDTINNHDEILTMMIMLTNILMKNLL